jgi:hypothetical protein
MAALAVTAALTAAALMAAGHQQVTESPAFQQARDRVRG